MFSGIVEELGAVRLNDGQRIEILASTVLAGVSIGDSINVNGVCLTVVSFDTTSFAVEVIPETLRRSNLGSAIAGAPVNLERSLAADGRIGGHFVQGHVDTTGTIDQQSDDGNGVLVRIRIPPTYAPYVVAKGFVALDGVSLTIIDVGPDWFTIELIPHTRAVTTLGSRTVGDEVNVEVDILGKYVERILATRG